ncbi:hypothetical protein J5U21_00534 [Saccharolobus shibatae]|uniref:Uncharacterized protein n=1 Tax=Saccharolobus shibatae TaxID=2286 RepID=A0A8F5GVE3_9CREN|nr:hypothetical protein J5U21_00534 [Saccharolobus shibatae]
MLILFHKEGYSCRLFLQTLFNFSTNSLNTIHFEYILLKFSSAFRKFIALGKGYATRS